MLRDGLNDGKQIVAAVLKFKNYGLLDLLRLLAFKVIRCLSSQYVCEPQLAFARMPRTTEVR
jgi:hypothetical protein